MFSVIIPTCNRPELLLKCLDCLAPSVQQLGYPYQVIVTDDSITTATKHTVEEKYHWVKWVAGPRKGPAANRNNGAQYATGKWLVFIDDDCLPNENLLREYDTAITKNDNICVFEGCILADREQRDFREESPINESGGALWSCNFMIQRDLFLNRLKGFDDQFPYAAMEDADLHFRIISEKISIVFVRDAFVVHPWRIQNNLFAITQKRFESTLYFLKKHPEKIKQINSLYFLRAFYGFNKSLLLNAVRFRFRGFFSKAASNFLQLYFAMYLLFNHNKGRQKKFLK